MISYRSITAATPTREEPMPDLFSTRTTFPIARIKTSDPRVTSAGRVRVMSSSAPSFKFSSMVKYNPRVETSRVFPFRGELVLSSGIRMITGRDKSYRLAVRRSVILPPPFVAESCLSPPQEMGSNHCSIFKLADFGKCLPGHMVLLEPL